MPLRISSIIAAAAFAALWPEPALASDGADGLNGTAEHPVPTRGEDARGEHGDGGAGDEAPLDATGQHRPGLKPAVARR